MPMSTDALREAYLQFFEGKGCRRVASDLLVPAGDRSVLFTPAGMNQFKEEFMGLARPQFTRATTCQKCIRTGDIENVGVTPRHMTFFEMLGNFSFGDYFKEEAVTWAQEFCVDVLGIDPARLTYTIYTDDDAAFDLWTRKVGVPKGRVTRQDEDENFWPAGAPSNGPDGVCGPCSEIFYTYPDGTEVEIWNLVFTQFNRVGYRELEPLPHRNIDTGMGLERTAAVLQGVPTVFDIDLFKPIVAATEEAVGVKYDPKADSVRKLRRIAEHTRSAVMCLHEGVNPSPGMQGYVVRRLIRRAVVDAYRLGSREPVLAQVAPAVVEAMKTAYPDLTRSLSSVVQRLAAEEERFLVTVERGLRRLDDALERAGGTADRLIPGDEAFRLHETYGFPVELTRELAAGRGVAIDEVGYREAEIKHQEISGKGGFTDDVFAHGPLQDLKAVAKPTEYLGDDDDTCDAEVVGIIVAQHAADDDPAGRFRKILAEGTLADAADGGKVVLVTDRTVFYGESGGQVGDVGTMKADGVQVTVIDTTKQDGYVLHHATLSGKLAVGDTVSVRIDADRRGGIRRAHSATHMLHAALQEVLGKDATQAGSRVADDELRFDFNHPQAVAADELRRIERIANAHVMAAAPVAVEVKDIEQARAEGAMALFGEKYGDRVRVVSMGAFSKEFCGGSHLANTGAAGPIRIVREESVSAGTRRITAVTGPVALDRMESAEMSLAAAAGLLKAPVTEVVPRIEALQAELRDLQRQLKAQRAAAAKESIQTEELAGTTLVVQEIEGLDPKELRGECDRLTKGGTSVAAFLASRDDGRVHLVCGVTKDLVGRGVKAGDWLKQVAAVLDGKGGGRPEMAQGGGKHPEKLPDALKQAKEFIAAKLT